MLTFHFFFYLKNYQSKNGGYLILSFNKSCLTFFSKLVWKTCQQTTTENSKRQEGKDKHCFIDQLLYSDFRSRSLKASILLTSWKTSIIHSSKKTFERHMDAHREKPFICTHYID